MKLATGYISLFKHHSEFYRTRFYPLDKFLSQFYFLPDGVEWLGLRCCNFRHFGKKVNWIMGVFAPHGVFSSR